MGQVSHYHVIDGNLREGTSIQDTRVEWSVIFIVVKLLMMGHGPIRLRD